MILYLCKGCLRSLKNYKDSNPPKFSIANNWASRSLPESIHSLKDPLIYSEIRIATRAPISSVLKVIGRNNKELRAHTMAMLAAPKPAIQQVSVENTWYLFCNV